MDNKIEIKVHKSHFVEVQQLENESDERACDIKISKRDFKRVTRSQHNFAVSLTRQDFKNESRDYTATPTTRSFKIVLTRLTRDELLKYTKEENTEKKYNLRERKQEINLVKPAAKRVCLDLVKRIKTPNLITVPQTDLVQGLVVLAKMKKYPAWPAIIMSLRKTCANVQYFGENSTGTVPYHSIGLFQNNHELIIHNLTNKTLRGYDKSVREAEVSLGIPLELSIVN